VRHVLPVDISDDSSWASGAAARLNQYSL